MTIDPDSIKVQIYDFLERLNKPYPSTQEEMVKLLAQMRRVGSLTEAEYQHLKTKGINESSDNK